MYIHVCTMYNVHDMYMIHMYICTYVCMYTCVNVSLYAPDEFIVEYKGRIIKKTEWESFRRSVGAGGDISAYTFLVKAKSRWLV